MIKVLDQLPSVGTPTAIARADGNTVYARLRQESMTRADWTTHDYNVHFLISLKNEGPTEEAVEILVNCEDYDTLPDTIPMIYHAEALAGPWKRAELDSRTDGKKQYAIKVSMNGGEECHLANTLPRPLYEIVASIQKLGKRENIRLFEYGKSQQGRPLLATEIGANNATPILITSGFHPPEPDTLATLSIIDWASSPAGRDQLKGYRLVVIPLANPDGYALGSQGSNAAGINMYWQFAHELPDECPEATALWELAKTLRPRGYIDFHCYTFQLKKNPGPYTRPLQFYADPSARIAASSLYESLGNLPGVTSVTGFSTYAPRTLGSMLTKLYQTVTLAKYHLHLKQGPDDLRAHGIEVLRLLLTSLSTANIYGPATETHKSSSVLCLREIWGGFLRPQLGLLRRGRFKEMRLRRTGLIEP